MKSSKLMIILLCVILVIGCIDLLKEHKHAVSTTEDTDADTREKEYIKWVEFNVTCEAMKKAYRYDLDTYGEEVHLDWVSLLAYLEQNMAVILHATRKRTWMRLPNCC